MVCGWQFWKLKTQAAAALPAAAPQLPPLWAEFYDNGKPIQIVIPNPTFFNWGRDSGGPQWFNLMVRDPAVNDFNDIDKSPELAKIRKVLMENYAVSSDVLASLKLMHYMDSRNVKIDIAISSNASSDLFEDEDVILVGTSGTLRPFRSQLDRLYFKFDEPHMRAVANPQPVGSEPREFAEIDESHSRIIYPGLVAVLPSISKNSKLMILDGQRTAALVSYLTSSAGTQQLQDARNRAGGAPFFEAVILSEIDGNTVLSNKLAALRAFTPKAQPH
jgi:hypothetical protein